MYSHCIFCKHHLGANVVIDDFPVGRRLAFDSSRGRLWVVCSHCRRWNLSPVEERWEAIEECERLYRTSRRRVSTDQIGLCSHSAGLDLVRIGKPQRPEMAAWRYGDELLHRKKRHRRSRLWTGAAFMIGWPAVVLTVAYRAYNKRRTLVRTDGVDGETVRLAGLHAKHMRLMPEREDWILEIGPRARPLVIARDEEAIWIAGQLLPWINRSGSAADGVERAVRQIERVGSPPELFRAAAQQLQERSGALVAGEGLIRRAPTEMRLALEMAAHEDLELQAAGGELAQLEEAWKEAEEIGQIADNLLIPKGVHELLNRVSALRQLHS